MDHSGMDMSGMDHSGMDHSGMNMAPGGIPLAQGGRDRDGLEMDQLHLRLGPFLANWPAGLVVRCTLQGDVITASEVQMMGAAAEQPTPAEVDNSTMAARHVDHIVDLLTLAGWPRGSDRALRLRRILLARPVDEHAARDEAAELSRLVRRSRILRWSLRDLAPLPDDVYDRLVTRCAAVQMMVEGADDAPAIQAPGTKLRDYLPPLIDGLDVAAARLVIAGLGIETSVARAAHHA